MQGNKADLKQDIYLYIHVCFFFFKMAPKRNAAQRQRSDDRSNEDVTMLMRVMMWVLHQLGWSGSVPQLYHQLRAADLAACWLE